MKRTALGGKDTWSKEGAFLALGFVGINNYRLYGVQLTAYSVLRVVDLINEGGWCLRSGTMYGVLSPMYRRSSLHLQDIVSSRSLHSCKGLYRTERRTVSLRIEVQLMVVCTDILELIFPLFFKLPIT